MSWNNRLMRHVNEDGYVWYAVHEVYYTKSGKIKFWDKEPVSISGDTRSDMFALLANCIRDAWRYRHAVLDYETGKLIKKKYSPYAYERVMSRYNQNDRMVYYKEEGWKPESGCDHCESCLLYHQMKENIIRRSNGVINSSHFD